jgi:hypothetical protein
VVAVCGGSGGRGSGAVIMTLFCCASGVAVATIVLLVKIGVGMDLFYLNAKKTSVCRLVQNFTSLLASSVQAPCKFVHVQRKSVARFRATLLRCTCSRWNSWISYCVHPSCMKTCNAKALHVFMQLGCKNLQVSLSETCTHLVEATYVARDCRRVPPHKKSLHTQHRHTHTQKTTTQYDSSTP